MKKAYQLFKSVILVFVGLVAYGLFRLNIDKSYHSMLYLFYHTQGKSRDFLAKLVCFFKPLREVEIPSKIFPAITSADIDRIVEEIRVKGYSLASFPLPNEIVEQIYSYGSKQPGKIRAMDENSNVTTTNFEILDPARPKSVRYDFEGEKLIQEGFIQDLASDSFFVNVAGKYLGCTPVLDLVAMWWTVRLKDAPDSNAAQLYHFDMDRIKWLKIFFYITDVDDDNGPHYFIEGSHISGRIPYSLLQRGYSRIPDEDVRNQMKNETEVKFKGSRGVFFFEDTSGLHKGEMVQGSPRLAFELQYSNCIFGSPEAKQVPVPKSMTEQFKNVSDHCSWF